jgi:hypothetical protein
MAKRYSPDYLKVSPLGGQNGEDIRFIIEYRAGDDRLNPNTSFGFFREIFRTRDWAVLAFHPASQDVGIRTSYKNRMTALIAAEKYLVERGFTPVKFDLEGMIDGVR